ncbi:TPA: cytochrome b/b6 domain-containing protein [Salmonella enterica subsp. diarizonae serovar 50:k:z35]
MITSGWRIYNASPLFNFQFPDFFTLGGWLGGALQWHFAAMWLFTMNGIVYVLMNSVTGRWKHKFCPVTVNALLNELFLALRGQLRHQDPANYNTVQKVAYLMVFVIGGALLLSGLAIWKPVQFSFLSVLTGGYENARWIHYICMVLMVSFICIHLVMVSLVPKTLIIMLRGR